MSGLHSRFRYKGVRSIRDVLEFADAIYSRYDPVCKRSREIYITKVLKEWWS